jgi:hypothetical protein
MTPNGLIRLDWMFSGRDFGDNTVKPVNTQEPIDPSSQAEQDNYCGKILGVSGVTSIGCNKHRTGNQIAGPHWK